MQKQVINNLAVGVIGTYSYLMARRAMGGILISKDEKINYAGRVVTFAGKDGQGNTIFEVGGAGKIAGVLAEAKTYTLHPDGYIRNGSQVEVAMEAEMWMLLSGVTADTEIGDLLGYNPNTGIATAAPAEDAVTFGSIARHLPSLPENEGDEVVANVFVRIA